MASGTRHAAFLSGSLSVTHTMSAAAFTSRLSRHMSSSLNDGYARRANLFGDFTARVPSAGAPASPLRSVDPYGSDPDLLPADPLLRAFLDAAAQRRG